MEINAAFTIRRCEDYYDVEYAPWLWLCSILTQIIVFVFSDAIFVILIDPYQSCCNSGAKGALDWELCWAVYCTIPGTEYDILVEVGSSPLSIFPCTLRTALQ